MEYMKYREKKTYIGGRITVQRRTYDYVACLDGDKAKRVSGSTASDAISKLVISHLSDE